MASARARCLANAAVVLAILLGSCKKRLYQFCSLSRLVKLCISIFMALDVIMVDRSVVALIPDMAVWSIEI